MVTPTSTATHFRFEALPVELQMHIISLANIVTDTPARDLCNMPGPRDYFTTMCCGCCEGQPRGESHEYHTDNCPCWPEYRFPTTSCECLILAQPLLAVSRYVRSLALEQIYRDAVFEIGPNYVEDFGDGLICWHCCLEGIWRASSICGYWSILGKSLGENRRGRSVQTKHTGSNSSKYCKGRVRRRGVQVTVICLYDGAWELLKDVVDTAREVRDRLGIEFVDIVVRSYTWFDDRSMGRIVE